MENLSLNLTQEVATKTVRLVNWYDFVVVFGIYAILIYIYYTIKDQYKWQNYVNKRGKVINVVNVVKWSIYLWPILVILIYGLQFLLMREQFIAQSVR